MKRTLIVKRVCITDTLRQILAGQSATFSCSSLGAYGSVAVAISRLNRRAGFAEYEIESADNGATYTVTRNPRQCAR